MGQKTHPIGFRVGITRRHDSRWYANKKDFPRLLKQDQEVRAYIKKLFYGAQIPRIEIERSRELVRILVHCAKPGVLIGRKGVKVDQLRQDLAKMLGMRIQLDIFEINKPELEGQIVAEQISDQLQRRMPFRRTLKKMLELCRERGARGVKLQISGRLGGAEIARTETQTWGQVPLQTLRADVRYGYAVSRTNYGTIGVKAWIYRGDIDEVKDDGVLRKERRNAPDA
ncbi:MAG: 30S ribosomal protein S3 [Planctomycetota bacterium]|jgi:small subunit ribosomal protein S3